MGGFSARRRVGGDVTPGAGGSDGSIKPSGKRGGMAGGAVPQTPGTPFWDDDEGDGGDLFDEGVPNFLAESSGVFGAEGEETDEVDGSFTVGGLIGTPSISGSPGGAWSTLR
ncbi:hypothetical protein HK097_009330 [Rhizophlyctis rosea]|uniref:Uncharacterized protein n=1 Tax=Rhizophlyctis rosea TaxID=64517 RepID=A0AAD5SAP3_9FUNG|nr:hypothetical protein HK097_009330 [Rhizophlyctis rosea]